MYHNLCGGAEQVSIFSYDSTFSQVVLRVASSCYLNLLWLVCSLPIVTAGAATAALYAVTLKLAEDDTGHLTEHFFHAFRQNFRQATVLWLMAPYWSPTSLWGSR